MMPPLLSLSIAVQTGNTPRRINLTTSMTSTTSPQTLSVRNILRSHTLTNLFPSLSYFCRGHAMMQKSWTPGPWRVLTLALTACIFTTGSPSHKGFQSQPANGLYLQSPKLLERNDAIHIIYDQTHKIPSKSLNLIYRYLQYPHPHFGFTHVSTSMQYIRRPWPSPRPGRRLGPPEVWILSFLNLCHAVDPVFLAPLPRPHCRQTPPQGHSNGSRAPHGRSNGFFYRRSRLPFAKPQTLQTFQLLQKFAQLRREKAPHGRSNGFFYRRSRLPFARPQTFQTLQTLDKSAQLRREKVPQQAQHALLPHAKRPTSQANGTPTSPTGATPAGKSHHKATAMAQGIPPAAAMASYRRSRLPFNRPQTLQTLQTLQTSAQLRPLPHAKRPTSQAKGTPTSPTGATTLQTLQTLQTSAQLRRQKVPQQAQHAPLPPQTFQTLQTLDTSAPLRWEKVAQQAPHAPLPHAKRPTSQANGTPPSPTGAPPAGKSHHKATAMAQGIPPAAAMASSRRSRLPFDRLQTLKTLKMPRRPFACIALCC